MPQPTPQPIPQPAAPPPASPVPAAGEEPYDLLGIGIGPFNLSLAALADGERSLRTLFVERKPEFRWHPGLLVDGARMQVPFLADLVSLVDPTSPWSFLAYLRAHDRLFPFYFAERFHLPRREYDHYCRWVAERLPHCRFGTCVTAARWERAEDGRDVFAVDLRTAPPDGGGGVPGTTTVRARNLVLGVGTEPVLPEAFAALDGHPRVWHAGEYRHRRGALADTRDVTVVGSGQSGAEVFLDLLRERERAAESGLPAGRRTVRWLTRSAAIAPMEYSKLGLEHFTPDYTRYFHALPPSVRDQLIARQGQLYKAASADTLAEIHDLLYERSIGGGPHTTEDVVIAPGTAVLRARSAPYGGPLELRCRHRESEGDYTLRTDAVILATGYAARRPALLDPLADLIDWDDQGRYQVDLDHRVALRPDVGGGLYVQNAELHTHGVGTPDLGLGAHRAAVILNSVAGRTIHRLPSRTAFTTFGPAAPDIPAESADPAAPVARDGTAASTASTASTAPAASAAPAEPASPTLPPATDSPCPPTERCGGEPDAEEPTRAAAR